MQIEVSPDGRFGLVPHLLKRVGLQRSGLGVLQLGEDHVVQNLRDEPVIAVFKEGSAAAHDLISPAHELNVLLACFHWRQRVEMQGFGQTVQVFLIRGFRVVADRPVIPTGRGFVDERFGELQDLGDLASDQAVVGESQGLVVKESV